MIVMAIGVIAIAALVGWALTRQVEPQIAAPVEQTTAAQPPVVDTATFTAPPSAPSSTATASAAPINDEDAVPRIRVSDLKARLGDVTIIDVRDDNGFRMGHIPGSLHIPFARIEGEAARLPRNKPIVTVCT